ncbi:transcriptional regulator ArgP (plasmid) [Pandoraea vervacti]|uniref:Transcriptional regulator ArgP n=1 Tax=Pandoraea vervacti TaxID=656178 RepID=A0ABM5T5H1_9BURK|nr:HTH-type transcriptional regulator ArgP [Pandoraea vervacti]AJP60134.1 transcriptional regulator ArgP [Pandoraea vervacti]
MFDREKLEAFASVARHKSFEEAASYLRLTRGAVSQRVRALEESLSCVLLIRSRPMVLTEDGCHLLRHIQALELLEAETLLTVSGERRDDMPIRVALGVNADSLATWFRPVLTELTTKNWVALEVVVDDQAHTAALLQRGEVMGCISVDSSSQKGFVSESIGAMRYRCVAKRSLVEHRFKDGFDMPSVLKTNAILFNRKDELHEMFLANHFGFAVNSFPRHYVPSAEMLYNMIREGIGYGLVPEVQSRTAIDSGELVDLAPNCPLDMQLFWHRWEVEPAICEAITATVRKHALQMLVQKV